MGTVNPFTHVNAPQWAAQGRANYQTMGMGRAQTISADLDPRDWLAAVCEAAADEHGSPHPAKECIARVVEFAWGRLGGDYDALSGGQRGWLAAEVRIIMETVAEFAEAAFAAEAITLPMSVRPDLPTLLAMPRGVVSSSA